jgi:hypothetical protein
MLVVSVCCHLHRRGCPLALMPPQAVKNHTISLCKFMQLFICLCATMSNFWVLTYSNWICRFGEGTILPMPPCRLHLPRRCRLTSVDVERIENRSFSVLLILKAFTVYSLLVEDFFAANWPALPSQHQPGLKAQEIPTDESQACTRKQCNPPAL